MAKALRKPTPSAKAPRLFSEKEVAGLPDIYGMTVSGDCLSPEIEDRTVVHVTKAGPIKVGDLIVIWRRPECVKPGDNQAFIKKLTMAIPPFVKFAHKDHPNSDVVPLLVFHQINPPRYYHTKCSEVLAVHRVIGPVTVQKEPPKTAAPRKRASLRVVKKGGARD